MVVSRTLIREVWRSNKREEMSSINKSLYRSAFIAIDTEFPGFLRKTPRNASETERYADMTFNVEKTKLIQFGFTLIDNDRNIVGTWEVNFSDFGESGNTWNEDSINFLIRNGLNLKKIREDGIRMEEFFGEFFRMLSHHQDTKWVTFHGTYDLAYLLKTFTGEPLPETSDQFVDAVGEIFGGVYDLKVMAERIGLRSDRLGLEKLACMLRVYRTGSAHHAGSDSLLTARVATQMFQRCEGFEHHEGHIYGISKGARSKTETETEIEIETITYLLNSDMNRYDGLSMGVTVSPYVRPVFISAPTYHNSGYYMSGFEFPFTVAT